MKRGETLPINSVLHQYIKVMRMNQKRSEVSVVRHWREIMGQSIADATDKIFIHEGTLYIYFTSSTIRNELFMIRSNIMKVLNDKVGEALIKNIVMK